MNKGHDKGHKGQMSDREVMKLALENICGAILCEINPMSSRKEHWLPYLHRPTTPATGKTVRVPAKS